MDEEVNVLALVKGEQKYIFLFDDHNRVETLRTLGRYAADPQLDFSWYDAAVMSKKIRETLVEQELEKQLTELGEFASDSASAIQQHHDEAPKRRSLAHRRRFSFDIEEDLI